MRDAARRAMFSLMSTRRRYVTMLRAMLDAAWCALRCCYLCCAALRMPRAAPAVFLHFITFRHYYAAFIDISLFSLPDIRVDISHIIFISFLRSSLLSDISFFDVSSFSIIYAYAISIVCFLRLRFLRFHIDISITIDIIIDTHDATFASFFHFLLLHWYFRHFFLLSVHWLLILFFRHITISFFDIEYIFIDMSFFIISLSLPIFIDHYYCFD